MKTRVIFILLAVAIISGLGFVIDKSERASSEKMVGFYIDIYAYDISAQGNVDYVISGDGNEWTSGDFNPNANKPQMHFTAPYSSFYGTIRVDLEYYGTEGCIRYKTISDFGYFYWPETYDWVFEAPYARGDCDE